MAAAVTSPVVLVRGANSQVLAGGQATVALFGPLQGGFIQNPQSAADQGVSVPEVLYVDVVQGATLGESATTIPLQPGQSYIVPPGITTNVSVNAATSGHRFSAYAIQPVSPITPQDGGFPPSGPTSLLKTINAYLYVQYNDDDDLQAFFAAYNTLTQQYVDWFNQINLPVYTSDTVTGALLDWVAQGLYTNAARPTLASGRNTNLGPLNTFQLNQIALNSFKVIGPSDLSVTSDDIYKRIITWNYYKGDGKQFNIRWLKRRIMRFLLGTNGTDINPNTTYQVSVTFGVNSEVSIRLINGFRNVVGGALLNRFQLNTKYLNELQTTFTNLVPLQNVAFLKEAIDSGALQLPFQFTYNVTT